MPSSSQTHKKKKVPILRIKIKDPIAVSSRDSPRHINGRKFEETPEELVINRSMPRNVKTVKKVQGGPSKTKAEKLEESRLQRVVADCEKVIDTPEISGYDQGWIFRRIVSLIRCNKKLYFYVEWTNNKVQLLSADEVKLWHAQEVIAFYEKITKWEDQMEIVPRQIKVEIEEPEPLLL